LHPGSSQNLDCALERGVQSRQTTQFLRLSSPCTAGLITCSTAGYCSRSTITTGAYSWGRSHHLQWTLNLLTDCVMLATNISSSL
jgi:hypothetical protein